MMRNIIEYPIDYPEAIAILDRLIEQSLRSDAVGDPTPAVLQWVKEKILKQQINEFWSQEDDEIN